jgi:hypothetical protein
MPVLSEHVHPKSLPFQQQRLVVHLRDNKKLSWRSISEQVKNRIGQRPSVRTVGNSYREIDKRIGRRPYKYHRSGRKAWKMTKEIELFIMSCLLKLRRGGICTSTSLQREVFREKFVQLGTSTIRALLKKKGYRWLPRAQKPKLSQQKMELRKAFAEKLYAMTDNQLAAYLSMCMDGVVLSLPPSGQVERENFCRIGDTHMWRKKSEAAKPELAGDKEYGNQFPAARAVPMWGGVAEGGFAVVFFHPRRKTNGEDWAKAVGKGKLVDAIKQLNPDRKRGPWRVLCDNESFLEAPGSREAHRRAGVTLLHIPSKSPDLNPAEKFWSWLRRRLRQLDLANLRLKKPPIGLVAFKTRVRTI